MLIRESLFHAVHLENMMRLARLGMVIMPPGPAFYNPPATPGDVINHITARVLDHFCLEFPGAQRWDGRLQALAPVAAHNTEEGN